jgi:hypothetical protein
MIQSSNGTRALRRSPLCEFAEGLGAVQRGLVGSSNLQIPKLRHSSRR